jgi:heme exporter protein D
MSNYSDSYQLPGQLEGLFCKPTLMRGESQQSYLELYRQVQDVVQPKDVLDQMLICDITNHFWESQRLRRCNGTVINAARRKALMRLFLSIFGDEVADRFHKARKYTDAYLGLPPEKSVSFETYPPVFGPVSSAAAPPPHPTPPPKPREPPKLITRDDVIALLEQHGFDEAAIDRVATQISVESLASLEVLALKHEVRRDAILREVERRRDRRSGQRRRTDKPAQPNGKDLPQQPELATTPMSGRDEYREAA